MSDTQGKMIVQEAFALGKMAQSHGWEGKLVRNITPSDIDLTFDFNGRLITTELKYDICSFQELSKVKKGQARWYRSFVRNGKGEQFAFCAQAKRVPKKSDEVCDKCHRPMDYGTPIDTLQDIIRFQLMYWDKEKQEIQYSEIQSGDKWFPAIKALER